jgi:hypothetical protein
MTIRNDILRRILIAEGGQDVITNRNGYLDRIGLTQGIDISQLQTRNEKLDAIREVYINPVGANGDFSGEFTSEFL